MAGTFTAINLSGLPFPAFVEALDYETILQEMIDDLRVRDPDYSNITESDPAYKILEVAAYRELLIRQRVNDAAQAVTLAYATGDDLDVLAANYNVERLVLDAGNPDAIPPVPPTYESDSEMRRRVLLAFEGLSTAGPEGGYLYHGLKADPDVKDISAEGPDLAIVNGSLVSQNGVEPGQVRVTVLSRTGDGTASAGLVSAVGSALSADDVRPLTDHVVVQGATISLYTIDAELTLYEGPDSEVVRQAAIDKAQEYADENHRLGRDITRSGLFAALHQSGVQRVNLIAPAADIVNNSQQAAFCSSVTVTVVGRDE